MDLAASKTVKTHTAIRRKQLKYTTIVLESLKLSGSARRAARLASFCSCRKLIMLWITWWSFVSSAPHKFTRTQGSVSFLPLPIKKRQQLAQHRHHHVRCIIAVVDQ
jgi:hypothetical protein